MKWRAPLAGVGAVLSALGAGDVVGHARWFLLGAGLSMMLVALVLRK